jgi:hypothetical protein
LESPLRGEMAQLPLVEFPLEDGGSVLIETDETLPLLETQDAERQVTRGLRPLRSAPGEVVTAGHSLEAALGAVRPAVEAVTRLMRQMAPDNWEVTFGIKLSAQTGALIARGGLEGNFQVRMTWQAPEQEKEGVGPREAFHSL